MQKENLWIQECMRFLKVCFGKIRDAILKVFMSKRLQMDSF